MGTRDDSPWTEAEEAILARAYLGGKDLSEISRNHHRSIPLVEEKLTQLGEISRVDGGKFNDASAGVLNEELGDPMLDLLKHTRQREREEEAQEQSVMLRQSLILDLESLQQDFDAGFLDEADFCLQSNRLTALSGGGEVTRAWLDRDEAERSSEKARVEAGGDGRWSELEYDPWEDERDEARGDIS